MLFNCLIFLPFSTTLIHLICKLISFFRFCAENEIVSDEIVEEKAVDESNSVPIAEQDSVNVVNANVAAIPNVEAVGNVSNAGESAPVEYQEAPSASAVPVPTFTPQQPQHALPAPSGIVAHSAPQNLKALPQVPVAAAGSIPLAQLPPNHQIHTGHVQATTVRAVESAYFKQHQYIQPMARPLAEVLGGTGNFFFLQDSELDSPDVPNNNNVSHQSAERPPVHQIVS